jgi:hypothetical protein
MQAMIAMGLVTGPGVEKPEPDFDEGKHLIDTIEMLFDKTRGNRTADETAMLDGLLHELRLGFLAVKENPALRQLWGKRTDEHNTCERASVSKAFWLRQFRQPVGIALRTYFPSQPRFSPKLAESRKSESRERKAK